MCRPGSGSVDYLLHIIPQPALLCYPNAVFLSLNVFDSSPVNRDRSSVIIAKRRVAADPALMGIHSVQEWWPGVVGRDDDLTSQLAVGKFTG